MQTILWSFTSEKRGNRQSCKQSYTGLVHVFTGYAQYCMGTQSQMALLYHNACQYATLFVAHAHTSRLHQLVMLAADTVATTKLVLEQHLLQVACIS